MLLVGDVCRTIQWFVANDVVSFRDFHVEWIHFLFIVCSWI